MSNGQLYSVVSTLLLLAQIINIAAQAVQPLGRLLTPEEGCGVSEVANSKIVGGTETKPGQYPWMTLLIYKTDKGKEYVDCGGSLITSRHILTAAHCIHPSLVHVRLGEHDVTTTTDGEHQDIKVVRVMKYPNYAEEYELANDIAILTLERDVVFDDRIRPICLPLSEELQRKRFVSRYPFVAGWGDLQENGKPSNVLMHVQIQVIDNAQCEVIYRLKNELLSEKQFHDTVVCAGNLDGGQDSCHGDSGGPLMLPILNNRTFPTYQIGIVSDGIGCARKDAPGYYTSVQHFMDWIQETIIEN